MPAAARVGDLHTCPLSTPGGTPHVGGPILPPGEATVLIGGMPAAVVGDSCVCAGTPDSLILGSQTVFFGGKQAVRMGDTTAHGGQVTVGFPSVEIG
ncbi:MAG: PAAR domain-containing protein [Chitinophagales bacterium]|nr:PAAR domain-containing protein [Chitinophagales bacterium]